jgi:hypothetical protein
MFWSETGAISVLNLRLALKSNRWDECWGRLNHSNLLETRLATCPENARVASLVVSVWNGLNPVNLFVITQPARFLVTLRSHTLG